MCEMRNKAGNDLSSGKCAFEERVMWIGEFIVHGVSIEELTLTDKRKIPRRTNHIF
jgi:hypothetical protein